MIPVAALIRVSTEAQAADGRAGIPRQQASIDTAVQRHGLKVVKTYTLEGVSGSVVGSTPEWASIRSLLDGGQIRGVVCDAVDRLCRASELDLGVLADVQRAGGSIFTPTEVRSLSSSADGLIAGILALVAGQEKKEILRRMVDGREANRRKGRWTAALSSLPPGITYDRDTEEWGTVEPELSEMVGHYRRIASGEVSVYRLAVETGMNRTRLRSLLRHPLYRGWLVHDRRKTRDLRTGKVRERKRKPENVIRVRVFDDPPIPQAITEAVDKRMASKKRGYKNRVAEDDPHHFRGLLTCARCGSRMVTIRRGAPKGFGYRCVSAAYKYRRDEPGRQFVDCDGNFMKIDDVHGAMLSATMDWIGAPGWLELALISALKARRAEEKEDRRPAIKARLSALSERRERLLDAYLSGLATKDQLERRKPLLDRQIEQAELELAELESEGEDWIDVAFEGVRKMGEVVGGIIDELRPRAEGSDDADLEAIEADLERMAGVAARLLKAIGGEVSLYRAKGKRKAIEVRGLRLDPRRLVEIASVHQTGSPM